MALLEEKKADAVHLYIAGLTNSQDFPTTAGAFSTTPKGNRDIFVLRFDPNRDLPNRHEKDDEHEDE